MAASYHTATKILITTSLLLTGSLSWQAKASTFDFTFAGPGVSGTVDLTYGTATDAKYPQAFEVTGISGVFSDSNGGLNLVDTSIIGLEPIKHDTPDPTNLLAPHDFSRFAVAGGVSSGHTSLSYDNLFYPGGSPQTASDYPVHGGFLDIYGLLFDIGDSRVVDLWSNGDSGTGHIDYGVAVATHQVSLDYVGGGVSVSPEPGAFCLLGSGLLGILVWRRRASR